MPLDAICLTALCEELKGTLIGGRVDKIYQPVKDEIILHIRTGRKNTCLLMSASPQHPRAQLTRTIWENPDVPPMFCMLLRKYFLGARLIEISQPSMERVLNFTFETVNELGDLAEKKLVLECIGRKSNLIVLDGEERIIESLRKVDSDISSQRPVLPGLFYQPPRQMGKWNLLDFDTDHLNHMIRIAERQDDKQAEWILTSFSGISPLIAREMEFVAGGDWGKLLQNLTRLTDSIKNRNFTPTILIKDEQLIDFSFMPILQYGPSVRLVRYESFSAMLDDYYEEKNNEEKIRQQGKDFIHSVSQARNRVARKIANQEEDLKKAINRERFRQFGDIITTNLYFIKKGQSELVTQNYYEPDCPEIRIPLDPLLNPQQNAAKYYKDYKKAQKAEEMLKIQLDKNRKELDYLDSVLEMITLSEGGRDLQEIRQELIENGYLKQHKKNITAKKKQKTVRSQPMEFLSSGGITIFAGKNNTQNDSLTMNAADKRDLWFHAQKFHGSHVILKTGGTEPDAVSVMEAAMIAAWFSQGKDSSKVPVDYTQVKALKKPAGMKPGYVTYSTYQTIYVTPSEELAKKLRVQQKQRE